MSELMRPCADKARLIRKIPAADADIADAQTVKKAHDKRLIGTWPPRAFHVHFRIGSRRQMHQKCVQYQISVAVIFLIIHGRIQRIHDLADQVFRMLRIHIDACICGIFVHVAGQMQPAVGCPSVIRRDALQRIEPAGRICRSERDLFDLLG